MGEFLAWHEMAFYKGKFLWFFKPFQKSPAARKAPGYSG
jgi:hypothetical protein